MTLNTFTREVGPELAVQAQECENIYELENLMAENGLDFSNAELDSIYKVITKKRDAKREKDFEKVAGGVK